MLRELLTEDVLPVDELDVGLLGDIVLERLLLNDVTADDARKEMAVQIIDEFVPPEDVVLTGILELLAEMEADAAADSKVLFTLTAWTTVAFGVAGQGVRPTTW